jgi:hypothetical protein
MPKQIILEYPWKAEYKKDTNCYYVYHYNDIDYVEYVVYKSIVKKVTSTCSYIHCLYETDSKIGQFFTQCQTELNNQ